MFDLSVSEYIRIALLGGILGTGAMTLVLYLINNSGLAKSDMVRAIGSLITKSYNNSLAPGIIVHFLSGFIFSIVYAYIIDLLNPTGFGAVLGFATAIGMFHGAAVGFLLEVSVAEHHPLEEFQEAGFSVAAAHWFAHVVFGLVVGLIIATNSF